MVKEGSCVQEKEVWTLSAMSVKNSVEERNAQSWLHSGNMKDELCLSIKTKAFGGSLLLFIGIKSKPESMSLITAFSPHPAPNSKPSLQPQLTAWVLSNLCSLQLPGLAQAAASVSTILLPCLSLFCPANSSELS